MAKSGLSKLLEQASLQEDIITSKNGDEIKKVEAEETLETVTNHNNTQTEEFSQKLSEKNYNITSVLSKRNNNEVMSMIRIPQNINEKIKWLSVSSKIPMTDIISNILEEYLAINKDEIDKKIKKSLK